MIKNTGYQITKQDIESTVLYLKTIGKSCSKKDAVNYLDEKATLAHMAAHKIVKDEQSGKIDQIKLKG